MIPRALVVILRVHLGVILLLTDAGKLSRDEPFSVEMLAFLQRATRVAPAPYRAFVEHGIATRAGAAIAMLFFSALVVCLAAAGRSFGVDALLHRRWPRVPAW